MGYGPEIVCLVSSVVNLDVRNTEDLFNCIKLFRQVIDMVLFQVQLKLKCET